MDVVHHEVRYKHGNVLLSNYMPLMIEQALCLIKCISHPKYYGSKTNILFRITLIAQL